MTVHGDNMEHPIPPASSRWIRPARRRRSARLALLTVGLLTAAGAALAQSSVTIGGIFDLNARYVKNDGRDRRLSLSQDGLNTSELVFVGTEDLGGGLKAGFNLRSAFSGDTGTTSSNSQFFNRRATVSLSGNFGEVRLGRDYAPTFWNQTIFDVFGTNGVGSSRNIPQFEVGLGRAVRLDNSIGYFLPSNLGGVYGQAMAAASEGAPGSPTAVGNFGRYLGGRIGYAAGPLNLAFAYAAQRLDATVGRPSHKTFNLGGSYDLAVVKLMGYYHREMESYTGVDKNENRFSLIGMIPLGQSEIHVGGEQSKLDNKLTGTSTKLNQFALGYVYNLSKRTALYTTASRLSNSGPTSVAIPGGVLAPIPGGASKAIEFGLRHFF
jgi:predicted porin